MNEQFEKNQEEQTLLSQPELSEKSLLDKILDNAIPFEGDRPRIKQLLETLIAEVLGKRIPVSSDTISDIDGAIASIDSIITAQLNEVMHHKEFQALESTWRGLHYLVMKSKTSPQLQIKVLNASKEELLDDIKKNYGYEKSSIYRKVYSEEYGAAGGHPYSAIIGDYEFNHRDDDMALLEGMSHIAAVAHAPFIAAADPEFFGIDGFNVLHDTSHLANLFTTTPYIRWNTFRDTEDSRYVGLVLPHMLGRLPYEKKSNRGGGFNFEEDVTGKEHDKYLWVNAAYGLGSRLTDAFARFGWCAAIRGRDENAGVVEDLPLHTFTTDKGREVVKCPTEIELSQDQGKGLAELGFIPLEYYKHTTSAVFFDTPSVQKPKEYGRNDVSANASAKLSAQLQYILAVSRFSHFLNVIMRDFIGTYKMSTPEEVQKTLTDWIRNYVIDDPAGAGFEAKAKYPLSDARIKVMAVPDNPGAYEAVAFLKPHFQLNEIAIAMHLVADIPKDR